MTDTLLLIRWRYNKNRQEYQVGLVTKSNLSFKSFIVLHQTEILSRTKIL